MEKQIMYQNFVLRVLLFVPLTFLLAGIEYQFLKRIVSDQVFFIISAFLTIIFASMYLQHSKDMFLKKASYCVRENNVCIKKDKNEIILDVDEIQETEIKKVYMYGISVARLTISYNSDNKLNSLVLYSRDLVDDRIEDQELWGLYTDLNQLKSCM